MAQEEEQDIEKEKGQERFKIMAIDDSEDILFLIKGILPSEEFDTTTISNAKEALEIADKTYDALVLDLMMPEMTGMEFLKLFRQKTALNHIPVIVLTAKNNNDQAISDIFELGANDYINKPFFNAEFISRIRVHARLKRMQEELIFTNKKLKKRNKQLQKAVKREEMLNERILDRTIEIKNANEKIEKLNKELEYSSNHDKLTNIYNRGAIMRFLENDINRTNRTSNNLSIIMFDIDLFKNVNDTYGHLAGDEVLRQLSILVKNNIREIDLMGRYGGEEFLIVLPDTDINEAEMLAQRLKVKIEETIFPTCKEELSITISQGLAQYIKHESIDSYIERTDTALYEAKHAGRNCFKLAKHEQ